jgi:hypothetical protein
MVQILASFLLLSALSGTCFSLSHPVKRDIATVKADIGTINTDVTNLAVSVKDFDGSEAKGEVSFDVYL